MHSALIYWIIVGRLPKSYTDQLTAVTGHSIEELSQVMSNKQERKHIARQIRVSLTQ